jgi:hypothetical protein
MTWLRNVRDKMAEETKDLSPEAWAAYVHKQARAYDASPEVGSVRERDEGPSLEARRARLGQRLEGVRATAEARPAKPFDTVAMAREIRERAYRVGAEDDLPG